MQQFLRTSLTFPCPLHSTCQHVGWRYVRTSDRGGVGMVRAERASVTVGAYLSQLLFQCLLTRRSLGNPDVHSPEATLLPGWQIWGLHAIPPDPTCIHSLPWTTQMTTAAVSWDAIPIPAPQRAPNSHFRSTGSDKWDKTFSSWHVLKHKYKYVIYCHLEHSLFQIWVSNLLNYNFAHISNSSPPL